MLLHRFTSVGFTGTRQGMTEAQRSTVIKLLSSKETHMAHHGGCIGADIDFDTICRDILSIPTSVHPSNLKNQQGKWSYTNVVFPEKPPLDRNKDIVDSVDFLVACPKGYIEEIRSGTWATIRYTRKVEKPLYIVYPNGSIESFNRLKE